MRFASKVCAVLALASTHVAAEDLHVYQQNVVRTPEPTRVRLPRRARQLRVATCVDEGRVVDGMHVCTPVETTAADAPPVPDEAAAATVDPFAAQMMLFHAARTLDFFATLGVVLPWSERHPLLLVANVRLPRSESPLEPWGDALFVRASQAATNPLHALNPQKLDAVYFGHGEHTRLAYDGDVIEHEVAHAVLSARLTSSPYLLDDQGTNLAAAAIEEGLADYFAAVIAGDPVLSEAASRGAAPWQSRNLDASPRCPRALIGRPHQDGLLLSSALWSARAQLGEALDHALIASLHRPRTFEELAQGVLRALPSPQRAHVEAAFRARSLLPACERVQTLTVKQTLSGESGTFAAPARVPGVMQFVVAVPEGAQTLRLRMRSNVASTLALLAKRSAPIRWRATKHDAEHTAHLAGASFDIPLQGEGSYYLQLNNESDTAGWYDGLSVSFVQEARIARARR